MAVRRPVYWNGSALKRMSDTELEYLAYYVRKFYANALRQAHTNNSSNWSFFYMGIPRGMILPYTSYYSSNTNIGSFSDTRFVAKATFQSDDNSGGADGADGNDYPSDPGGGYVTNSTTTLYQDRSNKTISDSQKNRNGYLYYDDINDSLQIPNQEDDIFDSVISECLTEMKSGDLVGRYRLASSSPGSGWVLVQSNIFKDTTHGSITFPNTAGNTSFNRTFSDAATYNLYVRCSDPSKEFNGSTPKSIITDAQIPVFYKTYSDTNQGGDIKGVARQKGHADQAQSSYRGAYLPENLRFIFFNFYNNLSAFEWQIYYLLFNYLERVHPTYSLVETSPGSALATTHSTWSGVAFDTRFGSSEDVTLGPNSGVYTRVDRPTGSTSQHNAYTLTWTGTRQDQYSHTSP